MNKKVLLGEYAYSMCMAADYDSAFKALNDLVELLGYDGILYTFIPRFKLNSDSLKHPIYSVSGGYSPEFISHYMEARFDRQDAMIKAISDGQLATMNWWEEVQRGNLSSEEKLVLDTARQDYGISNGITIPVLTGDQGIAGASIISNDKDRLFLINLIENQELLECCVKLFYKKVMLEPWKSKVFVEPLLGSFNSNERSVMKSLIVGKSAKIIASDMGIGIKYVEKITRQLRFKFSGENDLGNPNISTAELVYQAGLLSLMDGTN